MTTPRLLMLIAATTLLLAGCTDTGDDASTAQDPASAGPFVSPEEAAERIDDGATIIDVRTPEEFASGAIEDAVHMPIAADGFADAVTALDPDDSYVLYCRTQNRSGAALEVFADAGIDDAVAIEGGVGAWEDAGFDLLTQPGFD